MRTDETDRMGPMPLPDDSWDTAPTRTHSPIRRHRIPPRSPVALLILAVAALVSAVVVPLVLSGEPAGDPSSPPPLAGSSSSATTLATAPATTPESTSGVPVIPATASPAPIEVLAGGTKPGEGGFVSLTYEAEAGRLRGAEVVALASGTGVRFTSDSGEIELEPVDVPTRDRYRVTIIYEVEGDRQVAVRGTANAVRVRLDGTSGCCASATVDVRIAPGGSLTIEPSGRDGPLPTIDRVIIEPV